MVASSIYFMFPNAFMVGTYDKRINKTKLSFSFLAFRNVIEKPAVENNFSSESGLILSVHQTDQKMAACAFKSGTDVTRQEFT